MALIVEGESSSRFSNSNSTPSRKFHVFLSFYGQDTRKNFTDHLYNTLWEAGIITFRDDEGIEKGEVISQQMLKAIEDSLFSIVVLSKNYASSTWCLDELQKILEARKELGRQVFPIFYGLDPSDVRHQRRSFGEALAKHEERFKERKEKVQKWRDALTEVANLSGWDSNGQHETNLIENIVGAIWTKLWSKLPTYNDNLVGIGMRVVQMNSHLRIGLDDVLFVGIWGMGGIGKTTLARIVYERIFHQFDICCFLANVRENSESDGILHLQRKLLSHLKISSMLIEDTHEGKKLIKTLFWTKKVLLVLDDVNDRSQLENLAESPDWFGAGSRVIITTRDMHLLKSHGVHGMYEIEIMNQDESLQLLSKKAFKKDHPEESYLELYKSVVQYAGGLPLALKVLGSFLCGRSILEWKDALDKLKHIPNNNILHILKISYDGLDDEEKTIFLDIACFFKGWRKDEVIEILKNCGFHATIGLSRLFEKSLLIVKNDQDGNHFLEMHDLLQELGRSIVFQESNNSCKRSRLWTLEDIDQVLKNNMGTEVIQGMVLSLQEPHEARWDPEAFSKMSDLRLLIVSSPEKWGQKINELNLPFGLKCLSSGLKVVQWCGYPLKTLPLETPLDKLVDLKMQYSKVKLLWNGTQCLGKLKFIDLSHSKSLIETPIFSGVPNLERLILEGCTSLVKVHPSLGELNKLVLLNLRDCRSLKILPKKLEMYSLTELVLCGCSKVTKFPEFGKSMEDLSLLDLEDTSIVELPESLGFLIGLVTLNLKGCKNLVCLPRTFRNLKHLKTINIVGSSKFSKLPEDLNENEALENLDVGETSITEVPPSIAQLRNLKTLSFYGCKGPACNSLGLTHFLGRMFGWHPIPMGLVLPPLSSLTSLRQLNLSYCGLGDGSIPGDISCLSSLQNLELRGNKFVNLPIDWISNLLQLQFLDLSCCPRLNSLPNLPTRLVRIDAKDCASMEPLSDEQLWYHFSSLDHQGRYRTDDLHIYSDEGFEEENCYPLNDFIALMPGSEVPSWFPNKNDSCLLEETRGATITIDISECCGASEWSRIAICLVLDLFAYEDSTVIHPSNYLIDKRPAIWWGCDVPSDEIIPLFWGHTIKAEEGDYPLLCFMFLNYSEQRRWQHLIRNDSNQLEISIHILDKRYPKGYVQIKKWGWRMLCKEEIEEWRKKNDINKSSTSTDTDEEPMMHPMWHTPNRERKREE